MTNSPTTIGLLSLYDAKFGIESLRAYCESKSSEYARILTLMGDAMDEDFINEVPHGVLFPTSRGTTHLRTVLTFFHDVATSDAPFTAMDSTLPLYYSDLSTVQSRLTAEQLTEVTKADLHASTCFSAMLAAIFQGSSISERLASFRDAISEVFSSGFEDLSGSAAYCAAIIKSGVSDAATLASSLKGSLSSMFDTDTPATVNSLGEDDWAKYTGSSPVPVFSCPEIAWDNIGSTIQQGWDWLVGGAINVAKQFVSAFGSFVKDTAETVYHTVAQPLDIYLGDASSGDKLPAIGTFVREASAIVRPASFSLPAADSSYSVMAAYADDGGLKSFSLDKSVSFKHLDLRTEGALPECVVRKVLIDQLGLDSWRLLSSASEVRIKLYTRVKHVNPYSVEELPDRISRALTEAMSSTSQASPSERVGALLSSIEDAAAVTYLKDPESDADERKLFLAFCVGVAYAKFELAAANIMSMESYGSGSVAEAYRHSSPYRVAPYLFTDRAGSADVIDENCYRARLCNLVFIAGALRSAIARLINLYTVNYGWVPTNRDFLAVSTMDFMNLRDGNPFRDLLITLRADNWINYDMGSLGDFITWMASSSPGRPAFGEQLAQQVHHYFYVSQPKAMGVTLDLGTAVHVPNYQQFIEGLYNPDNQYAQLSWNQEENVTTNFDSFYGSIVRWMARSVSVKAATKYNPLSLAFFPYMEGWVNVDSGSWLVKTDEENNAAFAKLLIGVAATAVAAGVAIKFTPKVIRWFRNRALRAKVDNLKNTQTMNLLVEAGTLPNGKLDPTVYDAIKAEIPKKKLRKYLKGTLATGLAGGVISSLSDQSAADAESSTDMLTPLMHASEQNTATLGDLSGQMDTSVADLQALRSLLIH